MLDLPDELTSINTESFLRTSTNNIDQSLDVGPLSTNNTSNLTTPPVNNVMNPSGNPPTNVALPGNITKQNPLLMSNTTPLPNTVVSTSGDPTPILLFVSASPIHSSPASLTSNPVSLPGGNYQSPIHNSNVIGGIMTTPPGGPMDGRLPPYSQTPVQYPPNMGMRTVGLRYPNNPQFASPPHPVNHDYSVDRPQLQPNVFQTNPGSMNFMPGTVSQQPNKVMPGSESTVLTQQVKVFNVNV